MKIKKAIKVLEELVGIIDGSITQTYEIRFT